jgi:S-adenosylmethionine/arginine decarboxylase-like enzyme
MRNERTGMGYLRRTLIKEKSIGRKEITHEQQQRYLSHAVVGHVLVREHHI